MTEIEQVEVNGCDYWFDGNYAACCDAHDLAFATGSSLKEFISANVNLFQCVSFQTGYLMATIMFIGVMVGGAFVWKWKLFGNRSIYELIFKKEY